MNVPTHSALEELFAPDFEDEEVTIWDEWEAETERMLEEALFREFCNNLNRAVRRL